MFYTKPLLDDRQTPEQRAYTVRQQRRDDDRRRALCNILEFWRHCEKPLCRRNRTCSGDMHACFARRWELLDEDWKEWVRGALLAMQSGARGEELCRAADARRAEYLACLERTKAAAASPQASAPATPSPPPGARIRRL
jgi:hypothetical protein